MRFLAIHSSAGETRAPLSMCTATGRLERQIKAVIDSSTAELLVVWSHMFVRDGALSYHGGTPDG
eukprot:2904978-Prymnesium_polylepis.2